MAAKRLDWISGLLPTLLSYLFYYLTILLNQGITMTPTLYGIKNCDTVKKARVWLESNGVAYNFHDFKKDGVDKAQLAAWVDELGWEVLVNKRGTTWRQLPDSAKASVVDKNSAIKIMLENPSVIKRPVVDFGGKRVVGFEGGYEI
jgi:arsenate reductase